MRMKTPRGSDGRKRRIYSYSAGKCEERAGLERTNIADEEKKRL
jgi:hypothetical protein